MRFIIDGNLYQQELLSTCFTNNDQLRPKMVYWAKATQENGQKNSALLVERNHYEMIFYFLLMTRVMGELLAFFVVVRYSPRFIDIYGVLFVFFQDVLL